MTQISLDEIKRDLPAFLRRVETGETLVILKAGKPVAQLKPVPADTGAANAIGLRPYAWPVVNLLCRMISMTHYFGSVQPRLGRGFNVANATVEPW